MSTWMIIVGAVALFIGLVYAVYVFLPPPPLISPSHETIVRQYQDMLNALRETTDSSPTSDEGMREELRAVLKEQCAVQ
jgi:hypothetical protein